MNSTPPCLFTLLDRTLELHRWPLDQKNRTLQAWDSSDEYLINHVEEANLVNPNSRILLINDSFGALSCWFSGHNPVSVVDSFIAHQAALHNIENNGLTISKAQQLGSMDDLPNDIDLVLLKLPKNNGYLEFMLGQLSQCLKPGTQIIAAGKTTDIHNSTSALFERFIGETRTSLAKKKSRLVFATLTKAPQQSKQPKCWPLENTPFTIVNHANVFSRDSLDIGARLFINSLPNDTNGLKVIDLGCGNGVIGLSLLAKSPNTAVTFVDESYMAVASAQQTIQSNLPEQVAQCEFTVDDCLTSQANDSADIILCNPPFHQQQAVTDHIAWQMFKDARRVLKPTGRLIIVGNRNLAYHVKLNRLFGHCQTLDSNKKFIVLSAALSATKADKKAHS